MPKRTRGRPSRVAGEVASVRVWARLTPTERRRLDDCAREMGESDIQALVRDAINDYVQDCTGRKVFSSPVIPRRPHSRFVQTHG